MGENEEEYGGGIMDMSTADQVGVATFFAGLIPLGVSVEWIGWGFTGLVGSALLAGGLGVTAKHLAEKRGEPSRLPFLDRIKHANWGALLREVDEEGNIVEQEAGGSPVQMEQPAEEVSEQKPSQVSQPDPASPIFPRYPERETIHFGKTPDSRRFDPHVNSFLGTGVLFAGIMGTGKTTAGARFFEQAAKCGAAEIIFDFKSEYRSMISVVPSGRYADVTNLSVENAPAFIDMVMTYGLQIVVDLPSYGTIQEAVRVMSATLKTLFTWQQKRKPEDRRPCLIGLDEAHIFVPQQLNLSVCSREFYNELHQILFQVANVGRSFGLTLVVMTTRMAITAKWFIAMLQIIVVMKHILKNDLDRWEEELGEIADRETIKGLKKGTGIVVGLTEEPIIVAFDNRESRHDSHTPDISRAHTLFKRLSQKLSAPEPMTDELQALPDLYASRSRTVPVPEYAPSERGNVAQDYESRTVPETPQNAPVETVPASPGRSPNSPAQRSQSRTVRDFEPGPNDRVFSQVQERQFSRIWGRDQERNIVRSPKEYLREMCLGNSYAKYAGYVIKERLRGEQSR